MFYIIRISLPGEGTSIQAFHECRLDEIAGELAYWRDRGAQVELEQAVVEKETYQLRIGGSSMFTAKSELHLRSLA